MCGRERESERASESQRASERERAPTQMLVGTDLNLLTARA
jgi:hypothetical protein